VRLVIQAPKKYDYGQEVLYASTDENGAATTTPCAVVGIMPVETLEQAESLGHPCGSVLYTVEFGDGPDKLVSESELGPL
jgi:hypothetical protein